MTNAVLAIVLAAGEGTRMKSSMPKVLHQVAGRAMVSHALESVKAAGFGNAAVVVGPNHEAVASEALRTFPGASIYQQVERKGTGHAVLQAREAIARGYKAVVVLFGDTPLVRAETMRTLAEAVINGAGAAVMGFRAANPTGYGRLLVHNGELVAIREHKDASEEERKITLCNGGVMALSGAHVLDVLDAITNNNAQGEYYLPDAIEIGRQRGLKAVAVEVSEEEAFGVNDRAQLAYAESVVQRRLRLAALGDGVTMIDPSSVFLSMDTQIGRDVLIEPNVVFGPGVKIQSNVVIHAFSHLEGATVASGASVGPFARLRPGAKLGADAKVGNFVEIKNADVEQGAKISHLSYIGDARIGAEANIGAGTITCNYDGFRKFKTDVGKGAFIGSNSSLVAPVTVGDGAFVGSGSVITDSVEPDALALARGRQVQKEGWATAFRAKPENQKKKK